MKEPKKSFMNGWERITEKRASVSNNYSEILSWAGKNFLSMTAFKIEILVSDGTLKFHYYYCLQNSDI